MLDSYLFKKYFEYYVIVLQGFNCTIIIFLNVLEEVLPNGMSFVIYCWRRFILFPSLVSFAIQPQTFYVDVPRNGNKSLVEKWAYFTVH